MKTVKKSYQITADIFGNYFESFYILTADFIRYVQFDWLKRSEAGLWRTNFTMRCK